MSTSSQAPTPRTQSTSPGFKSFWRKSRQAVKAYQYGADSTRPDGPGTKKGSKTGHTDSARNGVSKRREQVYQAQKRHRDRKAEYLRSLEEEVARLQRLDALVNSQRNVLILQNQAFREYFATEARPVPFPDITSSQGPASAPSLPGSIDVGVRFDSEIAHERTFLNLSDSDEGKYFASPSSASTAPQTAFASPPPPPSKSSDGSTGIALDFILALEWPCKDHHVHQIISPNKALHAVDAVEELHGHALTMTAAVLQSSQPVGYDPNVAMSGQTPPASDSGSGTNSGWQIPHSEIDKLVRLSEGLELDEEQTTPAQAYAYVKRHAKSNAHLHSVLKTLKPLLSGSICCHGFGAVVPTSLFVEQATRVMYATAA